MSGTSRRGADRASRLARAAALSGTSGKVCPADRATLLLEAIIEPGAPRLDAAGDWKGAFAERSASAFADAFSDDVVLEGSTLNVPIVGRENVKRVMACPSAAGVHATQYTILGFLKHFGPMTMLQIASLMTMDRATIGHNLRPLARDGLVAIKVSEKRSPRSPPVKLH